jgi:hypothetical protein
MAWANALDEAIVSPRLPEILRRIAPTVTPPDAFANVMREFAEYCYGGAFVFSMK